MITSQSPLVISENKPSQTVGFSKSEVASRLISTSLITKLYPSAATIGNKKERISPDLCTPANKYKT